MAGRNEVVFQKRLQDSWEIDGEEIVIETRSTGSVFIEILEDGKRAALLGFEGKRLHKFINALIDAGMAR